MSEYRKKFELASKIIGLVCIIGGVFLSIEAVLVYLNFPDLFNSLGKTGSRLWRNLFAIFLIQSALPILIGAYLMHSGNIFIDWAYPKSQAGMTSPRSKRSHGEATEKREPSFTMKPLSNEAKDFVHKKENL
jgi:hypothetical protein